MEHNTELGYRVVETDYGLDVYNEYDEFIGELSGASLADYTYDGEVNDDKLEADIKELEMGD